MFLRIVNSWYCETFLIPNESAFICKDKLRSNSGLFSRCSQ